MLERTQDQRETRDADDRPTVGSLFAGIGGIDLGLGRVGFRTAWFCERDKFCQQVLAKHWPSVPCYDDVRELGEGTPSVDVLAGGFPCQPISNAGKRLAQADPRWLWPEVARLICILRPRAVMLENVAALLRLGFDDVASDLAAIGYDSEWDCIPAAAVGAPHRRDRVFIVAYPACLVSNGIKDHERHQLEHQTQSKLRDSSWAQDVADSVRQRCKSSLRGTAQVVGASNAQHGYSERGRSYVWWEPEPAVGRVADGIPGRVDRLRSLGNAVVPQVAEVVGRRVMEVVRDAGA